MVGIHEERKENDSRIFRLKIHLIQFTFSLVTIMKLIGK